MAQLSNYDKTQFEFHFFFFNNSIVGDGRFKPWLVGSPYKGDQPMPLSFKALDFPF